MSVYLDGNLPREEVEALEQVVEQVEGVFEHVLVKKLAPVMEKLLGTTLKEQNPGQRRSEHPINAFPIRDYEPPLCAHHYM